MNNQVALIMIIGISILFFAGCHTTYPANRTSDDELREEVGVVFVRPDRYSILGTRSIRDYIEITYEQTDKNQAGYPMVQLGVRNRGGQNFWDLKGPEVQLSVQTAFYRDPIQPSGAASGPAAYRSNWQTIKLVRGQTTDYEVTCPIKEAEHYQVTISEYLR